MTKDIRRVAQVLDGGLADDGFVIVIANDKAYWTQSQRSTPWTRNFVFTMVASLEERWPGLRPPGLDHTRPGGSDPAPD